MNYILAAGLLSILSYVADAAPVRRATRGGEFFLRAEELDGAQEGAGSCAGKQMGFEEFVQKFKRSYVTGSKEYEARKTLFEERTAESRAHNCRPGSQFWQAGATSLSDWNVNELTKLRGRKGTRVRGQPSSGGFTSMDRLSTLDTAGESGRVTPPPLPASFSWKHLEAMNRVFDQGACGSCWASATAVMLRAHTDIYQQHRNLSVQQLVSCVPNPEKCGGSGGCNGSTGELALDYVFHNGLGTDEDVPYVDGGYHDYDAACPVHLVARNKIPAPQPQGSNFLAVSPAKSAQAMFLSPAQTFGMTGWSRLPVNKLEPLYDALYRDGPLAVSIVSGYAWNAYVSGIMNNCSTKDAVINHLVVLIGYGADTVHKEPKKVKYWHIQNSWGTEWGEQGQIRMIRQDTDEEEEAFCGINEEPLVGTGCEGGPDKVKVCGSCGILYDSVVAHFSGTSPQAQEMQSRRGQRM